MTVEQLLLCLPSYMDQPTGTEMTVRHWQDLVDQFAAQGGRELLLGGAEPLGFPGFWQLVRRSMKARIPRVTAYLSGRLLEPWVLRELIESGLHMLLPLSSLKHESHDVLYGNGSHIKAMAAVETLVQNGLAHRTGVLATVTRLTRDEVPLLASWTAGRGLARFLWTSRPDSAWSAPQAGAQSLSPEEKRAFAQYMLGLVHGLSCNMYIGPLDYADEQARSAIGCRLVRVGAQGEAYWGFFGEGGHLGNVRRTTLMELGGRESEAPSA